MALKNVLAPKAKPRVKFLSANDVVRDLENAGICVPENFSSQLRKAHNTHRDSEFSMNPAYLPSILRACEHWKPFLSDEDWNTLVLQELLSMSRIHVSIINLRDLQIKFNLIHFPADKRVQTRVSSEGLLKADHF